MSSTTGNFTLVQMPKLSPEWAKAAAAISVPFRGEPSLPLLADGAEAAPDAEPAPDADPDAPPPERFREMHRLAFVTANIDHDVAVLNPINISKYHMYLSHYRTHALGSTPRCIYCGRGPFGDTQ